MTYDNVAPKANFEWNSNKATHNVSNAERNDGVAGSASNDPVACLVNVVKIVRWAST